MREALRADRNIAFDTAAGRVFVQVFSPPLRCFVVGAVHIAQPLAPMLIATDYKPIVIDPRGSFATEARFPGVELSTEWPDEALERLKPDQRTAVVTLTHDPKLDDPALAVALRSECFYIGALGSQADPCEAAASGSPSSASARTSSRASTARSGSISARSRRPRSRSRSWPR